MAKRTFTEKDMQEIFLSGEYLQKINGYSSLHGSKDDQLLQIKKIKEDALNGKVRALVLPARTDTEVFHQVLSLKGYMIFLPGRYRYLKQKEGKACMVESMYGTVIVILKKKRFSKKFYHEVKSHQWTR